jgi:hypothetical protein
MLEKLTGSDFSPLLKQKFQIKLEGNTTLVVQLTEVTINENSDERNGRQSFSIVFRGPRDLELTQGMYPVSHEELGEFSLFLVPIGPDEKGMCFEAVFN